MSIDTKEFKKGNSLIVGKKVKGKENKYEIDGVLVYDAYCLSSSKPYLLQCSNTVFNIEEPVYICGHGDGKKQTISGYSMKEIAGLLIGNTNISQIKKIVIMSCHGKHKNRHGDDMASLLQKELSGLGIQIDVESVAEHTTIVVDYFNKALVADKKYIRYLFSTHQTNLLNRLGCLKLMVNNNTLTITNELDNYLQKYGKDIAVHNYALISKGRDNKMDTIILVGSISFTCVMLGALGILLSVIFSLGLKWFVCSSIFFVGSIIVLGISIGFFEWSFNVLRDSIKKLTSHHTGNNDDSNNN